MVTLMVRFSRKQRDYLKKAALAVASVVVALLIAEAGVRFLVLLEFSSKPLVAMRVGSNLRGFPSRYTAYGGVRTNYDRDFGFAHVTSRDIYGVRVEEGMPVLFYKKHFNALGNIGKLKEDYDRADLKILVFGDSFTAMQHKDVVWPKVLESLLCERLSKDVNVLNFGRDGYGILQLFDLAASKVREYSPDFVIIAFISDDLRRSRVWRTHRVVGEDLRLIYSNDSSNPSKKFYSVAGELIHTGITREWCISMEVAPNADDPVLKELRSQFVRIRKDYVLPLDCATLSRSYILDRILHGDVFYSLTKKARPDFRVPFRSFAEDPRFIANVAALNAAGVPYELVHLPTHPELEKGSYVLTLQQRALLRSLEKFGRREVVDLMQSRHRVEVGFEELFLLPYDHHPSAAGLEFYAQVVADAIVEKVVE